MECPRCKLDLAKPDPYRGPDEGLLRRATLQSLAHRAGVEIDRCSACGGIFLNHGELEKIQSAAWAQRAESDEAVPSVVARAYMSAAERARGEREPLRCPSCSGDMHERDWGYGTGVTIDVCIECRGVWLDHGELEAFEEYFSQ
jgi:Zn-finger nucleic acid-binding protein